MTTICNQVIKSRQYLICLIYLGKYMWHFKKQEYAFVLGGSPTDS